MNSFPKTVIKNLFKKSANKEEERDKIEEKPHIYKTMTYIPGISERLEKTNLYNKENYKIAYTTNNTLKNVFSNTKSKPDKMDSTNVVYKIKCMGDEENSCNQVYVGTTKNKLKTRMAGHKSDIKNRNKFLTQKTALMAHCAERQHKPQLENVEILQREKNNNKRYILEMLHIINTNKEERMNYKTDVENCAQSYRNIINKAKTNVNNQCNFIANKE